MLYSISSLYIALLALLYIYLSVRVAMQRMQYKIEIGSGDNHDLQVSIRAHANFIEYVPLIAILLILFEANYGSSTYVHILGLTLLIARASHAYGFIRFSGKASMYRATGAVFTLLLLLVLSLLNIMFYIGQIFERGLYV